MFSNDSNISRIMLEWQTVPKFALSRVLFNMSNDFVIEQKALPVLIELLEAILSINYLGFNKKGDVWSNALWSLTSKMQHRCETENKWLEDFIDNYHNLIT